MCSHPLPPFPPCDVAEQDGHRFPIPVPDVDVRFREVFERDAFGMSAVTS
jgi:hypothetical protein